MDNSFTVLLVTCIVLFVTNLGQAYLLKKAEKEHSQRLIEIKRLREKLCEYDHSIYTYEKLLEYKDDTPDDCKRGPWCGACEFGKVMMVYSRYGQSAPYYFCTKGECCDYWVERKSDHDGD